MNATFNPMNVAPVFHVGNRVTKTFREAAESYLARSPSHRKYLDRITAYIGDKYLHDIFPIHARDLAELMYPNQANSTRNRCVLAPIRAVFYHAYDYGWCNPLRIRSFKEEGPAERPYATYEWMVIFLRQCKQDGLHRLAALCLFLNRTGARISEALRLKWDDVDIAGRKAVLRKTKTESNSVRFLTDDLVRHLNRLDMRPGELVFGYINRHSINERLKAVCKRAKIRYLSTHAIGRRAFAKNTVAMGIDTKSAMVAGGWKSSKIFLEIYVQSPDGGRIVADRFNQQGYDNLAA